MDILITLIENNEEIMIKKDTLNYRFLYSAYADDSTFLSSKYWLNDETSKDI